jgi:peptide/nickel transport system ATP-binding protein
MDLRVSIAEGDLDIHSLSEHTIADSRADSIENLSTEEIQKAIKEKYNLPAELCDDSAEKVLTAALTDISRGSIAEANQRLQTEFSTICESSDPQYSQAKRNHWSKCYLNE